MAPVLDPAIPGLDACQCADLVLAGLSMAIWRRRKRAARGDPDHDYMVAGIVARLIICPAGRWCWPRATHLNLLPCVQAS